ncbi:MAG: hypothetical protein RR198_05510 [Oscillospiraceae bacterium]
MTAFLNILLMLVSVFFFSGRLYELLFLVEDGTNFLMYKGIASNPFIIFTVILITLCCGIILFSDIKKKDNSDHSSAGSFSVLSGLLLVVGGVLQLTFLKMSGKFYYIFIIVGGIGLIILGLTGLKGKKKETVGVILTTFMCIGFCLDVIIFNVSSIADTAFLMRSISAITNLIFFTLLFKMTYAQDKWTRMGLYVAGVLNFIFTSTTYGAVIVSKINQRSLSLPEMVLYFGFGVLGLYSLLVSFVILPTKSERAEKTRNVNGPKQGISKDVSSDTVQLKKQTVAVEYKKVYAPAKEEIIADDSGDFYPKNTKINSENSDIQAFFTQSFDMVKTNRAQGEEVEQANDFEPTTDTQEEEVIDLKNSKDIAREISDNILKEEESQQVANFTTQEIKKSDISDYQNLEIKSLLAAKRADAQKKEDISKQYKAEKASSSKKIFGTKEKSPPRDLIKKDNKPSSKAEKTVYRRPSDE